MANNGNLDLLINQIDLLNENDTFMILEKLIYNLKLKSKGKKKTRITQLRGLGNDIWKNVNIESYINELRQWE